MIRPPLRWLTATLTAVLLLVALPARAQAPPATPPADWGPMSINLEDVPYPYPVQYFAFTVEGQDVRMAYMDVPPLGTPNGRTLVLFHGMNFFGEAWTPGLEVMRREGFRCIAVDQIGFGRSSKPVLAYSMSLHASNTRRLLDHLGLTKVSLLTHSMGGMVGSRFASSYPAMVEDLAMVNQIGLEDVRATRPWRETADLYTAALARDYTEILQGMQRYYVRWKPEYMKYVRIHYGWTKSGDWPRMAMVRALQTQAIYSDPVVDDWPRIRARTLVVGGEQDGPNFPALARRVATTIPGAQLVLFPGVGHNPQFEAPDQLFPVLVKFFRGERVQP